MKQGPKTGGKRPPITGKRTRPHKRSPQSDAAIRRKLDSLVIRNPDRLERELSRAGILQPKRLTLSGKLVREKPGRVSARLSKRLAERIARYQRR